MGGLELDFPEKLLKGLFSHGKLHLVAGVHGENSVRAGPRRMFSRATARRRGSELGNLTDALVALYLLNLLGGSFDGPGDDILVDGGRDEVCSLGYVGSRYRADSVKGLSRARDPLRRMRDVSRGNTTRKREAEK